MKKKMERTEKEFSRKNTFVILMTAYLLACLPLIRANFSYVDDLGRTAYGYAGWEERFSRYLSTWLSHVLHAGDFLSDISPIPQLLAICIMALSGLIVLYLITGRKEYTIWEIAAVLPLGLSPYFMQCLSYKYDAPYMALSVLFSLIPLLLLRKSNMIYFFSVVAGTIAMCMTYQASSGIFPMMVVIISLLFWNQKKRAVGFIFKSAAGYLAGVLFYQLFLMKPAESYVSNGIAAPREIIRHYLTYYRLVISDLKKVWILLIIFIGLSFIICAIVNSRQKKLWALAAAICAVIISSLLSWGLYPALEVPSTAPRAMYGFGIFVSLIGLFAVMNRKKYYITKIAVAVLGWCFLSFSLVYGNALAEQEKYTEMRTQAIINDLNSLEVMQSDSKKNIQLEGTIGLAPVIRHKPQNYKMLNRLIPDTFSGLWYWGGYKLIHYYGIPNIVKNTGADLREQNLPLIKNTMYHNIYGDTENILIELK